MLGSESLFVLAHFIQLLEELWMNPFHTCEAGLTVGLKSRYQDHTNAWSAELDSSFPCGTRSHTGTPHWASGWNIKSRARIILRVKSRVIIRHPCNPIPHPPHFHTMRRTTYDGRWRGKNRSENQVYRRINQKLNENRTKLGKLQVTDIEITHQRSQYSTIMNVLFFIVSWLVLQVEQYILHWRTSDTPSGTPCASLSASK